MLSQEQLRTGLINPARRWPNRIVPFVMHGVFSEYCSTKLLIGIGRGGKNPCIMSNALAPVHTGV